MKTLPDNRVSSHPTTVRAFTLVEMMINLGVFSLVVAAIVATQLFALRMYTLAATKVAATSGGRQAMNIVRDSIREAKTLQVGNCTVSGNVPTFTPDSITTNAQGNALQVFTNTDTTKFTLFYLDTTTTTNKLKMCTTTTGGTNFSTPVVLASYITNNFIFWAEDYLGHLTNNNQNSRCFELILQFYQWEYPVAAVGPGNMYDFYQLRTRATRRTID
jgi:type II secretory pathway pseudopilin PulG